MVVMGAALPTETLNIKRRNGPSRQRQNAVSRTGGTNARRLGVVDPVGPANGAAVARHLASFAPAVRSAPRRRSLPFPANDATSAAG
jgi:hypothetical protein